MCDYSQLICMQVCCCCQQDSLRLSYIGWLLSCHMYIDAPLGVDLLSGHTPVIVHIQGPLPAPLQIGITTSHFNSSGIFSISTIAIRIPFSSRTTASPPAINAQPECYQGVLFFLYQLPNCLLYFLMTTFPTGFNAVLRFSSIAASRPSREVICTCSVSEHSLPLHHAINHPPNVQSHAAVMHAVDVVLQAKDWSNDHQPAGPCTTPTKDHCSHFWQLGVIDCYGLGTQQPVHMLIMQPESQSIARVSCMYSA